MPLLTISGHHIDFPDASVESTTQQGREFILNWLRLQRLTNRMAHWMRKQSVVPSHAEFQAELLRQDSTFSWSDLDDLDAVESEAREIASATILQRLAQSNLPPPKDIEPHIQHLIASNPNITRVAQERVMARIQAAREILGHRTFTES